MDRNRRSTTLPSWNPLAVFGARRQVARGVGTPDAHPGVRRVGVGQVLDHLAVHPGHVVVGGHGLQHAGLHALADTGLLPHVQCGRDAPNQRRGRRVADPLHDHKIGALPGVLLGGHHHPPALGRHHAVVTLVVGVGSAGSEPGQRGMNQSGIAVTQALVVDSQPTSDTRTEVFDHHIAQPRQLMRVLPSLVRLQVQDDTLLATIPLDGTWSVPVAIAHHVDRLRRAVLPSLINGPFPTGESRQSHAFIIPDHLHFHPARRRARPQTIHFQHSASQSRLVQRLPFQPTAHRAFRRPHPIAGRRVAQPQRRQFQG